ncbi:MAG: hypothetical protein JST38_05770 [Bacteroidetes bacterium]|nr:hypothetical protein [Bacteroidota bacterium]
MGRMLDHKHKIRIALYLLCSTFLISALAFYNGYPLVFSDSGTYIRSAFTLVPPADRPVAYGLIIRAVTWQDTLWTLVIFQAFMLAWLLLEVLRKVLPPGMQLGAVYIPMSLVLVAFTSMPWYAAQVMPDIITPMIILVLYLILRAPELGPVKRGFLWTCLLFFLMAHYAHVPMVLILLAGLALANWIQRGSGNRPYPWASLAATLAVLAGGITLITVYNAKSGLGTSFSPTRHMFLAARLCENGMLGDFLREHCDSHDYALCPFKDELPMEATQFIWGDHSIIARLGPSLTKADSAVAPAVQDLFAEPVFIGRFARSSMIASATQLFQVSAASGLSPYAEGSAPYYEIVERLPWELSSYSTSRQAKGEWWDLGVQNRVVRFTLVLALFVLYWKRAAWMHQKELRLLVPMLLAWVVLNAVVTASLANVFDRLQSRVAWLPVLAACLVLLQTKWAQRTFKSAEQPR